MLGVFEGLSSTTCPRSGISCTHGSKVWGRKGFEPSSPVSPQIGSYYGSEINSLDVNGDGVTDVLLVGAPMYFSEGRERGKVYVYALREVRAHPGTTAGPWGPLAHSPQGGMRRAMLSPSPAQWGTGGTYHTGFPACCFAALKSW